MRTNQMAFNTLNSLSGFLIYNIYIKIVSFLKNMIDDFIIIWIFIFFKKLFIFNLFIINFFMFNRSRIKFN